jgi:hypothetical protein
MNPLPHLNARRFVGKMGMMASLIGALALLAFPIRGTHQFTAHFRTGEIRRSVESHTFATQAEADPAKWVADCAALPAAPMLTVIRTSAKPLPFIRSASNVPLRRLLLRFKVGPAPAGAQDPLIQTS